MSMPLWIVWLIVFGICLIVEIFTISFMYLWGSVGAIFALIFERLGFSPTVQFSVFAFSTTLMIIFTKPLSEKLFKTKEHSMNNKSLISKTGKVLKTINNGVNVGQVKVAGEVWSAISVDDDIIEEGSEIIVNSVDGVKLIVNKK